MEFDSNKSSLKIIDVKTGSIIAPATSGTASNEVVIPHGLGNDELIVYLTAKWSSTNRYVTSPWTTPDGKYGIKVSFDTTNVYITAYSSTAGTPNPATTFDYNLLIAIP